MKRQALVVFVILNVVISIGVALLVIEFFGDPEREVIIVQTVPVPIVITATPVPPTQIAAAAGQTPGNPPPGSTAVSANPTDFAGASTLDPNVMPDIATDAALTLTAFQASGSSDSACGTYTVQEGDNPSLIAETLEVTLGDLLCINNLGTVDDPDFIFPGQELLVPCPDFVCATFSGIGVPEETPLDSGGEDGPLPTVNQELLVTEALIPTVTLASTAANAQIVIAQVLGAGDVTSEGIEIRNQGGLVDLGDWTLYDVQGNTYIFPDYRLFPNAGVTVFSRIGDDTPMALFWGQSRAVWEAGDVVTLANGDGEAQSTFRVGVDGLATVPAATEVP